MGAAFGVGLAGARAVRNPVGTDPEAAGPGKQADNKDASRSKVTGKLRRAMLNPLDEYPVPFPTGWAPGLGHTGYRNIPVR